MSIEDPFKTQDRKKREPIQGKGFVMEKSDPSNSTGDTRVEFRPDESSDKVKGRMGKDRQKRLGKEGKDISQWTDTDLAEEILVDMLTIRDSYSETFQIKSDGSFEDLRADGKPRLQFYGDTPTDLYQIAQEIEIRRPEYRFFFATDPQGKWMRYTVSKDKAKDQEHSMRGEELEVEKEAMKKRDDSRITGIRASLGIEPSDSNKDIKRELAEKIENYPYLNLQEKVELLLVLGGYKKANEQDFESEEWYEGQPQKNIEEEKINAYEKLLKEVGLAFEKKREITKSRVGHEEDNYEYVRNIERTRYIFAKTEEDIGKYEKAVQEQGDELFGEIYGFPRTSSEAFGKPGGIIEYDELPDAIRKSEAYAFLTFKLSHAHYQEEFETAKKWADFVRRNAPGIYQEYLEFMGRVEGR